MREIDIYLWPLLKTMEFVRFVHWQDDNMWLGYLEEYPDYMTQSETLDDLKDHLLDLYEDLTGGKIPCARRVAQLKVSCGAI